MARDPVCGMGVDEKTAARKAEYSGMIYYFCAPWCLREFLKSPGAYLGRSELVTSSTLRGIVKSFRHDSEDMGEDV